MEQMSILEGGNLGNEIVKVYIGSNLIDFIVTELTTKITKSSQVYAIITDENISKLYLDSFIKAFLKIALIPHKNEIDEKGGCKKLISYSIPPGEPSKTRSMKEKIENFLLSHKCNRDTVLIALGGGVVGDLTGFVASTFLRGIPFVQIPTTLLAMVDSSIGGKNGVDTEHGKNLIGTTYQPTKIYVDLDFLNTLSWREIRNGFAEIIKIAAIGSEQEFNYLEKHATQFSNYFELKGDEPISPEISTILFNSIKFSINAKALIVIEDVGDYGKRQLLNFGHTLGHAIEHLLTPQLLHGECISLGMIFETQLSAQLGHSNSETVDRIRNLMHAFTLPTSLDENNENGIFDKITMSSLLNIMRVDKKNSGGGIQIILLEKIGSPFKPHSVPVSEAEILSLNIRKTQICFCAGEKESIFAIGSPQLHKLVRNIAVRKNWTEKNKTSDEFDDSIRNFQRKFLIISDADQSDSQLKLTYNKITEKWTQDERVQGVSIFHVIFSQESKVNNLASQLSQWRNFSSYTCLIDDSSDFSQLLHLIEFDDGKKFSSALPSSSENFSFFVCVTEPSMYKNKLGSISSGAHAIELRADKYFENLETFKNSEDELNEFEAKILVEISTIRSYVPDMPIIFTLRTISEGGFLKDEFLSLDLLLTGIKLGCEIIDLQIKTLSVDQIKKGILSAAAKKSKIIASFHAIDHALDWGGSECENILKNAQNFADVVKIVSISSSNSESDNKKCIDFTNGYYQNKKISDPEIIALNMGLKGRITRVNNKYLTPVTHDEITNFSPNITLSQLTARQILQVKTTLGQIEGRFFYLFGTPISHSLSPLVHNTIFNDFNLPHIFKLYETSGVEEVSEILKNENFGGASVTMPHKIGVISLLDSLSEAASTIGAVNTIIVKKDSNGSKTLFGDNTDWAGIKNCLKVSLLKTPPPLADFTALVIGAGGTSRAAIFALSSLQISTIFIHNRTYAKCIDLRNFFLSKNIHLKIIESLYEVSNLKNLPFVIVDTTPSGSGSCTNSFANHILEKRGILVKLAYAAEDKDEISLNEGIELITGVDILIAQGLVQSKLWTGLRPNEELVKTKVNEYLSTKSSK